MTTTFQSREAVRDELVALFVADGSWEAVYGYYPGHSVVSGTTPVLTIISAGTAQSMGGVFTNKASYRFILSSFVMGADKAISRTADTVEDQVDTLDLKVRQVIRDNAALTNGNIIRFGAGVSQVETRIIESQLYIIESRDIFVDLLSGSI